MKIFLSGVSGQFKACRDALRSDLSAVGAKVVVQEDFQQHGASLLEKLESYIASCDRVIALVGDAYGFEPEEPARPLGRPRRSYTQWEYFFAMGERLDGSRQPPKDTFLYFGLPEFLAVHSVSQSDDTAQLQLEFMKEVLPSGKDRNEFSVLHELRALVLRDGFQLRTREAQARNLPYTSIGRLFKGREQILTDLHERLQQNPGRALAIYGPAGVGKTRLTIEYAMRYEAQYTALLTAVADSGEALQRNLAPKWLLHSSSAAIICFDVGCLPPFAAVVRFSTTSYSATAQLVRSRSTSALISLFGFMYFPYVYVLLFGLKLV